MSSDDEAMQALCQALPMIAGVTGGVALVADLDGRCLHAVGSDGLPRADLEGRIHEVCREAALKGVAVAKAEGDFNSRFVAAPLGEFVLGISNEHRAIRQSNLFETLKETLPLIARVAGGEAVLFDREGRRLFSADPKRPGIRKGSGKVSESCLKVMRSSRPDIGPSRTLAKATAVRIPIGPTFGFGFNNSESTMRSSKLLDQVRSSHTARYTWEDIAGSRGTLGSVLDAAHSAARSMSSVVIYGESGTGKELIAQAIHNGSARAGKPFLAINCGALPETLVESTFFGYEDGAFTGARRGGQKGLFEQADGGTLLLDEISEMPIDSQVKLLRVLQEREIVRIGGGKAIPVDVRVISTSNRDLTQLIDDGAFRADLFYRLNVLDIHVPPVRERRADIPALVDAIRGKVAGQEGRPVADVPSEIMDLLQAYEWPGNVRELHNVVERALNLAEGDFICREHLPTSVLSVTAAERAPTPDVDVSLKSKLFEAERTLILDTLERCNGNRSRAARELDLSVSTFWRRHQKILNEDRANARN